MLLFQAFNVAITSLGRFSDRMLHTVLSIYFSTWQWNETFRFARLIYLQKFVGPENLMSRFSEKFQSATRVTLQSGQNTNIFCYMRMIPPKLQKLMSLKAKGTGSILLTCAKVKLRRIRMQLSWNKNPFDGNHLHLYLNNHNCLIAYICIHKNCSDSDFGNCCEANARFAAARKRLK